jgi:hypothetical protein
VQPSNASVSAVLPDASQNVRIVWGFDNQQKKWLRFTPGALDSTLLTLDNGKGYWAYMDDPAYLSVSGTDASPSIRLSEGWNLIGYQGPNGTAVDQALSNVAGKWSVIWGWDSGQWYVKHTTLTNLPFQPLTNLRQGAAYWIKIKSGSGPIDWVQ